MSGDRIRVRAATVDDLPFMQRMLYEAANRPGDSWPQMDECINEPRNLRFWEGWPREGDIGVIAEDAGSCIGAAWLRRFSDDELLPADDPDIPVLAIAVEAGHRGRGVGHALLGELLRAARACGVAEINLTTGLFNEAALRLYRAHGFQEVYRRGDAVKMRASLA